ncbi:MAG TPA: heme biosynthesis HemY N-terminal domain-containing protein, partial [Stellaceae bacterium]|nr:heme biosynthesis HemY N-terminal domain-containing protein [Stellaceae bacterium]
MRRRFFAVRAVLGLALIAAAVAAAAFFADHPGQVGIVWLGRQADTSVAVLAGAVAALLAIIVLLALVIATLRRLPRNLRWRRAARRRRVGEAALTRGIV